VRSSTEGTVRRYAVSRRHSAEVRSEQKAQVRGYAAQQKAQVRSYAGQIRKNCGSFLKYLLAAFYLLLQSSGSRFLVLLFCLQHSEKLGDSLVDCIRRLGDSHVLDD